jgi:spore coat-associated protein N
VANRSTLRRSKKILLSLAAVGSAASIAGLGTYATFTSTETADQSLASGTVDINLGTAGTADNRLTIGATGMVPGDSLQRLVKITNAGSENLASLKLTTTAPTSSLLDTGSDGLRMRIQKCSVAWVEVGTSAPFTYTCAGTASDVIAERAVIGTDLDLGSVASLAPGGSDSLVVTVSLPTSADNNYQNKSSVIRYSFTGTQRAGGAK